MPSPAEAHLALIVEAYRAGASTRQIGDDFGLSRKSVDRLLAKHGVRRTTIKHHLPEIDKMLEQGATRRAIGKEFGLAPKYVSNVLRNLGYPVMRAGRAAIYSDKEIAILKEMYAAGLGVSYIARKLKRNRSGVYLVLKRVGLR